MALVQYAFTGYILLIQKDVKIKYVYWTMSPPHSFSPEFRVGDPLHNF